MWSQRSFRTSVGVGLVVGFVCALALSSVVAQGPPESSGNLNGRVQALEDVTRVTSDYGYDTLLLTGMNLQVVNGSGATIGVADGTGNVIIGYNEPTNTTRFGHLSSQPHFENFPVPVASKAGSHNLVVGTEHSYSLWSGILAGRNNVLLGVASTASGRDNTE